MNAADLMLATEVFPEPHIIVTSRGLILAANSSALETFKVQPLVGMLLRDCSPDHPDLIAAFLRQCAKTRSGIIGKLHLYTNGTEAKPFRCDGGLLVPRAEDEYAKLMLRFRQSDIASANFAALSTQVEQLNSSLHRRQMIQSQLEQALTAKEVLLREVKHRVKNNLQSLLSLFELTQARESDERMRQKLVEVQNRVKAMAAVHEVLYDRNPDEDVKIGSLLRVVAEGLVSSYGRREIALHLDLANAKVTATTATSLALITNEIMTNCFKYAFERPGDGKIEIILKRRDDKAYLFIGRDDGCGMQNASGAWKSTGLGLGLIQNLARSMNGQLTIDSGKQGTSVQVLIPKLE